MTQYSSIDNIIMTRGSMQAALESFVAQETLPHSYIETAERWYLPMLERVLQKVAKHEGTYVLGISGSQGSGKSTLAALLVMLFRESLGLNSINLSMDDFYLTRGERQKLAHQVHPLLVTRGVPGTHDIELAKKTIESLQQEGEVSIVRFNKAMDDRAGPEEWPLVHAPVDVVILEGWCLGIGPQSRDQLLTPINQLEQTEDSDGIWRNYVNEKLQGEYQSLNRLVDYLIMLKAPGFDSVFEWRQKQEDKLAATRTGLENSRIMSRQQLFRFIQHYERVTRHGLQTLPERADEVFALTEAQTISDSKAP